MTSLLLERGRGRARREVLVVAGLIRRTLNIACAAVRLPHGQLVAWHINFEAADVDPDEGFILPLVCAFLSLPAAASVSGGC
eukprot:5654611-Pleurochrysis_carterae.AAC.4